MPHFIGSQIAATLRTMLLAPVVVLLLLAAVPGFTAPVTFQDVAPGAGVAKDTESYGASWGDVNGDGYLDLFVSNHRNQPSLYLNRGNGTFVDIGTQVTTWVNRPGADTHGGAFADFDADGDQDLLIAVGTGNPNQFFVNEQGALIDRTAQMGLEFDAVGGRLPVWFDYNQDGLIDFVLTQFGGAAKVFRQTPSGFVETTSVAGVSCLRFHYGLLLDVNQDGQLDFICPDDEVYPQKVYNTAPTPWQDITTLLPSVPKTADSILADFDNDQRMDLFVLSNVQLRPSNVLLANPNIIEANLTGGEKGFNFLSGGPITVALDWNKLEDQNGLSRILIGGGAISPFQEPFLLDPADPTVWGLPPANPAGAPLMRIGYDPGTGRWTFLADTQDQNGESNFSESYFVVTTNAPVSDLQSTGLWGSDYTGSPMLVLNQAGGFTDQTAAAGLGTAVQCGGVTAGDFDNDTDVDLYLACRSGTENLPNIYYDNQGNGTFVAVPGAGGATGPLGSNVTSGAGTADIAVAADFDVDGFLDIFVPNGFGLRPKYFGGPGSLFKNQGNGNHWIQVDLVGTTLTRDPVGARVTAVANGVTQARVVNGSYHRWSQEPTRLHFGLATATTVDLTVQWPGGATEVFTGVAADQLYRITEGNGGPQVVTPGVGSPYPCGAPSYNAATERGVFLWRDCTTDKWQFRFSPGGVWTVFSGDVRSTAAFPQVTPYSIESGDVLNYTTDPKRIVYQLGAGGSSQDGFTLQLNENSHTCFKVDSPVGTAVRYGPFKTLMSGAFDIQTGGPCEVNLPEISVANVSAAENTPNLTFLLTLSAASAVPVSVEVSTWSGTATAGVDFTDLAATTVTFNAGETQKPVVIALQDDLENEDAETMLLRLSDANGATLATAEAIGTITDDEISACGGVPVYNAATEAAVFIGKSCVTGQWHLRMPAGGSATTRVYQGTLVSSAPFALVTPYSVESGDTFDYTTDPLTVNYRFNVSGSGVDGMDVTPAPGASVCFNLDSGTTAYVGPVRIAAVPSFDLETLGPCDATVPQLTVAAVAAAENAGSVNVVLSLSTSSSSAISVDVQTADGSATAGEDYSALALTTVTFNAGETSKSVPIALTDDALAEGPETFTVQLGNASGAALLTPSVQVTINDDETSPCGAPAINGATDTGVFLWRECGTDNWSMRVSAAGAFGRFSGAILSSAAYQQVTGVSLEGTDVLDYTTAPVQISYVLEVSGAGLDGADFRPAPGASACFGVNEPAGANVLVGAGRTPLTPPFDLLTLGACSSQLPVLSVSTPAVDEDDGEALITVSLSQAATVDVTADITVIDGTAVVDADYLDITTTSVVIPAGELSVSLALPVLDDALAEGEEQLTVQLSNPVNATFASSQSDLAIIDNEVSPCGAPTINTATEPGMFLWKNCSTGQWSLRAVGGNVYRTYGGNVDSSAPFAQISKFSIEASDFVDYTTDPSLAQWTMIVSGTGQDGLDFRPAAVSATCISVTAPAGTMVAVGPNKTPLTPPFDLATLGACGVDPAITVRDASVNESQAVALVVALSKPAIGPVSMNYVSADVSAVAPADYAAVAGTLTIPAGSIVGRIDVNIVDDQEVESAETFTVQLSNAVGATIARDTATATIVDNDAAGLGVSDVSAAEGDGSVTFTVSLTTPDIAPVTVEVSTVDGEASAGLDYVALPATTLTFDPGEVSKTVQVTLLDDSDIEGYETFSLQLANASGANIADATGIATINDDEALPVVSVADGSATENAGTLTLDVSLTVASTQPVSVDYAVSGGTATAGTDYATLAAGTLVFDPGETLQSLSITLMDDAAIEDDETINVQLSNPVRATAGTMSATGTIEDNEADPVLTIANVTANEGSGTVTLTATLSAASTRAIAVDYATANGSATAPDDYTAKSGTLQFAAGVTSQAVTVALVNDAQIEINENFSLALSNPVNVTLGSTSATVTITDDEAVVCGAPTYNAATESVVAVWQDCTTGRWSVRATAGGGWKSYSGEIYSNQGFSSISGVSLEGSDQVENGTNPAKIVFRLSVSPPGYDGFDFNLPSDASACFNTSLPNGAIAIVGSARTVVGGSFDLRTLGPCAVLPVLSVANVTAVENSGVASFQLTLSQASSLPVSVDVATANGTAQAGSDYQALASTTVTFLPGETSKNVDITLLNDADIESAESFSLNLSHVVNASFGVAAITRTATASITDDDVAPQFRVSDTSVAETAGTVDFNVTLTAAAATETRVTVQSVAGTASAGVDYTAVAPTELIFAPGDLSKAVSLTLLDDALAEGPESFQMQLSSPVGIPIATGTATVSITDNEPSPCGPATFNATTDTGLVIWKNCATGTWSARFVAGSGFTVYDGVVASSLPFTSVSPVSIESTDVLNSANPVQISYSLRITVGYYDGFDFLPQAGASTCVDITSPAGRPVYLGAARTPVTEPFNLATLGSCNPAAP